MRAFDVSDAAFNLCVIGNVEPRPLAVYRYAFYAFTKMLIVHSTLYANILIPQFRFRCNKLTHQTNAFFIIHDIEFNTT